MIQIFLIFLLVYVPFAVYYGLGVYKHRLTKGDSPKEALKEAIHKVKTATAQQAILNVCTAIQYWRKVAGS